MTPHINAKKGSIAKYVLMPGDPLRAKFMAEKYLENPKLVSSVRNIFIYTGTYKGKEVSIAASGMGCPSIGIYAHELFASYGVESIIRVGSCGAYIKELNLYDIVLAKDAYTDNESFGEIIAGLKGHVFNPSKELNDRLIAAAAKNKIKLHHSRVHSSDVFYAVRPLEETIAVTKSDVVEMESTALFVVAKKLGKKAACLLTVSDNLVTHEQTSPEQRQNSFTKMVEVALEAA